jgi:hypothetical protein
MSHLKKRTAQVEEVRRYVEGVAKSLVDRLYGPDGPAWGTSLTEIEDLLLEVREVLSQRMLNLAVTRQAQALACQPEAVRACPGCRQPLACADGPPRVLGTRAGTAEWPEPEGYCPRCRRAFFPSVQEPGP